MVSQLQNRPDLTTPVSYSNAAATGSDLKVNARLAWIMIKRDLVARYHGSFLGAFWPFINPLGHLLLYTFVFSIILKVRFGNSDSTANFAVYLMAGLIPWGAFAEAIARSTTVILEMPNLVKKVVFPLEILPVVTSSASLLSQMAALALLMVIGAFHAHALHPTVLLLPIVLVFQLLFTTGLAWTLASLGVFVRDIKHFIALALSGWMYATPIVYPASAFPSELRWVTMINPMSGIVQDYRRLLLEGQLPDWGNMAIYGSISIATAILGYYFFAKTKKSFADVM